MTRARLAVLAAAAAGLCALSGCASVERVPSASFSTAELDAMARDGADAYWDILGLPDELRPETVEYTIVPAGEWYSRFKSCLKKKGFAEPYYDVVPAAHEDDAETTAWKLADYTCQEQFLSKPTELGLMNTAQSNFAYDYFQQTLIPCLAVRGLTVNDVPSRELFLKGYGWWNPYWGLDPELIDEALANRELRDACPPIAAGLPDFGQFG